jgi:hypothetical protein
MTGCAKVNPADDLTKRDIKYGLANDLFCLLATCVDKCKLKLSHSSNHLPPCGPLVEQ